MYVLPFLTMKLLRVISLVFITLFALWYERVSLVQSLTSLLLARYTDLKATFTLQEISSTQARFSDIYFPKFELLLKEVVVRGEHLASSPRKAEITVQSIDFTSAPDTEQATPLQVTSLKSAFTLISEANKTTTEVHRLSAQALGGTFKMAPTKISFQSNACNVLSIVLSHIEVPKLMALYPNEKITATGTVRGKIPVTVCTGGQFHIDRATLTAEDKGTIQVDNPTQSGNPGVDFTFQALRDFYYETLQAELTMKESGDMIIALSMRGVSHSLEKETPIVLNVKVEENLWALINSIKITENIKNSFTD